MFLLELARKRQKVESVNLLLGAVFRHGLDQDNLHRLYDLHDEERRGMAVIATLTEGRNSKEVEQ